MTEVEIIRHMIFNTLGRLKRVCMDYSVTGEDEVVASLREAAAAMLKVKIAKRPEGSTLEVSGLPTNEEDKAVTVPVQYTGWPFGGV